MNNDLLARIQKLERDIFDLNSEIYSNNFTSSQDFNKASRFNYILQVPTLAATPATCEVGQICCVSGKLRVCSAANTWTVVGTQV